MADRIGQQLGNYRILRELGRGGFADAYLGEHIYLKSYAALKILHTSLAESDVARFLSEAQTLVRLRHPHIVRVLEFVIEGGTPVLMMDYAPGGTARQLHPRGSLVPLVTVVTHIKQVAAALHYAHSRNVIHRDVKPENLLLSEQQELLLSDFGLALMAPSPEELSTQEMAGTIPYMAPEQIRGKPGFASDQYALGIIAYEWLCGTRPFEGTAWQILQQHLEVTPPCLREKNADVPEEVEEVVQRALAKDPRQRFVSVQAFSHALERTSRVSGIGSQSETTTKLKGDSVSSPALLPDHRSRPDSYLPYGVFLAAATADDVFVTRLSSDLEEQGRGVFVWNGRLAGTKYATDQEEALRQEIRAARLVVVVLTPHTRSSRTVKKQLQIASMYERELLLVWQDGDAWAELLPDGWESTNVLDVLDARGMRYKLVLDEIVSYLEDEIVTSASLAATLTKPREESHEPRNPYKGLRAFTGADAEDFFGRGRLVESLLEEVARMVTMEQSASDEERLLSVIGPSGSGKSSVLMAGFLPRLQLGALPGSESWVFLEAMTPGKHPIEALGLALAKRFPDRSFVTIREDLEDDSTRGLHVLANQLVKQPGMRVVLLVDQFEELFAQTDEDERRRFIELLLTATTEPRGPLLAALTLRADFYDRPMLYPELYRLIQKHQSQVPPMEVGDLRETIEQPAALADVQLTFEGNLVGDLLYEMQRQPGALPLLQFTLEQLFERRDGHRFTLRAYREIGGVKGAISQHAEKTYTSLPSEEHRRFARALFLRLIDPGITEQDTTRRRAPLSEFFLTDTAQTRLLRETIDVFVTARLLMTNEVGGTTTIEVSHEVLIREWPRLTDWLGEAHQDIPLQQAISEDVAEWERHGRPRDRPYRGSQLKEAKAWAQRNMPSSNEVAFLQAGATQQLRFRLRMVGVTLLIFLLLVPTGWLVWQHFQPSVTTLKDDGPGSLRQAIVAAKPGDTITFDSRLRGTIVLAKEDLNIPKNLTILGPGADILSISGGNSHLNVHVLRGFSVVISGLTFKNSKSSYIILNEGKLTLTNCLVFGNTSTQASGGGISNYRGTLTLINSTVSDNTASGSYGGGISNYQGTLTLTNSTVSDNTASGGLGGGISNYQGTLTLTNSTVSGNTATRGSGGGISDYQGTLTLTNSTVSGNTATRGGGISDYQGTLTLTNSTVSGNTATGGNGGGIANSGSTSTLTSSTIANNTSNGGNGGGIANSSFGAVSGMLTLINSTISSNRTFYQNGYGGNGGGIFNEGSRATITFCTVYKNTATGSGGGIIIGNDSHNIASRVAMSDSIVAANSALAGPDISGNLSSQGYNLIQSISGATIQIDGLGKNIIGSSPKLGALQNNGGPTRTHALPSDSLAIDQIPLRACRLAGTSTDQRGVKRPDDSEQFCDIGAYEYALPQGS